MASGLGALSAGAEMTGPKPAGRRWTHVEENQLRNMLDARLTAEEIARRLARTPVAIYSRVQYLDRKRRNDRQWRGSASSSTSSAIADPAIPRFDVTQPSAHINFDAPAVLRKWPSLHRERRTEGAAPYRLVDGTLDECIRVLMAKPASLRHLYEIHTSPQPPLVSPVLSGEYLVELARLCRSLLDRCR
jgi:hypothetical protein